MTGGAPAAGRLPAPKGCGLSWLFGIPCPGHGRDCPWHRLWRRSRAERDAEARERPR